MSWFLKYLNLMGFFNCEYHDYSCIKPGLCTFICLCQIFPLNYFKPLTNYNLDWSKLIGLFESVWASYLNDMTVYQLYLIILDSLNYYMEFCVVIRIISGSRFGRSLDGWWGPGQFWKMFNWLYLVWIESFLWVSIQWFDLFYVV